MIVSYQKPRSFALKEQVFLFAQTQYILKLTNEYCYGATCGHPVDQEYRSGTSVDVPGCVGKGPAVGEETQFQCLETGGQIYYQVCVGIEPGGDGCLDPSDRVIYHMTVDPGLPQTCTITSIIMDGVDLCSKVCNGSNPSCSDSIKNGNETDVDCGGLCTACATGKQCAVDADCTSNVCTSLVCQAPSCGDGTKNGSETDVDCGGGSCSPCNIGKECLVDSDCYNAYCSGGYCTPY